MSTKSSSGWRTVGSLEALAIGAVTVVKTGERRIAVFRTGVDEVRAVDDRCPHEGYPLSKGIVAGEVLTCSWHNYKFDLRTGRCLKGDEDVPCHAARIRDGLVEIRVTDPPADVLVPKHMRGLEDALADRRMGQAAREVVRLLRLGVSAELLAFAAARWDATHAEYGTTHALPLAVDVLALARQRPGSAAALPLLQAFDMASESSVRRSACSTAPHVDPGPDATAAGDRLLAAIEAEDLRAAEGLLRGALHRGFGRAVIEPWLLRACTQHFLGFGHALIYAIKAFDLLEEVGWEHAPEILPALVVAIVNQTREDLLPEWAWFRQRIATVSFDALWAGRGSATAEGVFEAVLDGSREQAFDAVVAALHAGADPTAVIDALALAAAARILRFDANIDADPTVQEGWLDVTHLLTFADATRRALDRLHEPDVVRLLLQAARFVNNARALDGSNPVPEPAADASVADVIDRIRACRPADAVAAAARVLTDGYTDALQLALDDLALDDRAVRPIVVAHVIKTTRAAFDTHRRLPPDLPHRDLPVLAAVRFVASPIRERALAQQVHEAIRFVEHGKVPRTLT